MSVAQPSVHWKRLLEPPALPGWLTLGWKLVNALSNIDYLQTHLGKVWQFCTSPTGNVILILLGLLWLAAVVLWPRQKDEELVAIREQLPAISSSDLLTNQAHEIAKIRLEQLANEGILLVRFTPKKNANQSTAVQLWSEFVSKWKADVMHVLQSHWGNNAVTHFVSSEGFNEHEAVGDILDVAAKSYRDLLYRQKMLKELIRTLR